ncbi:MAG: GHKL domain-containing protein [Leptolyngbyaceae cyanobacterium RM2_2_4]|nr:GHKL domain-containing protein [Leptolyngbyaceae cyanobacterium RM2_2_4]
MRQTEHALKQERAFLETKVIERTQEIQAKNAVLAQTLSDLKQSQMKLIQAEKMSSLGQLVTGIAHEINTPLGAIQSSVGNITHALQQALKKLPTLLQTLPLERLSELLLLLEWAQQPQETLSSREERQLKRQIKQSLDNQGIAQAETLSGTLSKMGITVALDPILPLLRMANAPAMLQTVYQLVVVQNNSQNIRLAVERASRIVYALRNFARQDVLGVPSYASISEGIETVLMLYQNQIKHGIEVETQYAELPPLIGYPEELVQVWSNLVSNAIQSMNYRGKLAIATSLQDQHIVVQIADTGKGISPDIQDKIFEPFFTTKARGEGTGLGLSIVKNIIDKHHGKIEVESQTGTTTFRVYLPLQILPEPLEKDAFQR